MNIKDNNTAFYYKPVWKTVITLSLVSLFIGVISWPILSQNIWNTLYHNASVVDKEQALRLGTLLSDDLLKGIPQKTVLNSFQQMLETTPQSKSRFACIVKGDETVIAHPDPLQIGKDVSKFSLTDESGHSTYGQAARKNTYFTGKLERPDHSVDLINQMPIATVPWTVTIHTSYDLLNERLNTIQQAVIWVAIPSTMILIFLSTLAVRLVSYRYEKKLNLNNEKLSEALLTLQSTQKELIESERMASLGLLVSGVSHQLNSPVGVCITASSANRDICEDICTKMNMGQLTKKYLSESVNKLLSYSKLMQDNSLITSNIIQRFKEISVEQTGIHKHKVEIGNEVREIINKLTPDIEESGCSIYLIENSKEDLYVDIDSEHFNQVMKEVILNALIHGYKGKVKDKVTIEVTHDSTNAVIKVSDNGIGMTPEVCDNIFSPFYTASGLKAASGLGLHVVYNIIHESMKGTIKVQSTENIGTTFSITIPLEE
jgi:signal transduction histidine kinase